MKNEIGAGWVKEGKSGGKYIAVKLGDGRWLNIWKNDYKKSEKQPDYRVTTNDEEFLAMFGKQEEPAGRPAMETVDDVPF